MNKSTIEIFCDRGIFLSLCAVIFVLPVSIALLNSFSALAIFFYFIKKINNILVFWPLKAMRLNLSGKVHFIWEGFAPIVNPLGLPLQFLALAIFISVVFSQYPMLSLYAFFGKFLKSVFLYFCFVEVFRDERRIRIFLGVFLASAFIMALSGIIQHFSGVDFLKGDMMRGGRINASFNTANGFGAYLVPVIALTVHLLYSAIVKNRSWVLGGALLVLLGALLASLCWTYSRSSWVGYLVTLFVMVLLDPRKILFAGALVVIFVFVFLPALNNVRHLYLINDDKGQGVQTENSSNDIKSILEHGGSGRLSFWEKAITIFRSSPVYGTGFNTYSRIIMRNPDQRTWWYAHNCYLQLAAETGILGLACFLWLAFILLGQGLKYCNQIKELWPLSFLQGTVSGLFGFLVQSSLDNTFYTVQLGALMWLIFGLTVALIQLHPSLQNQGGR